MQLVERNKKWVLYDDSGNVVIIARNEKVCRSILERMQDERSDTLQTSIPS